MACRIMVDRNDGRACFTCTVTDVAFGPIMESSAWATAFAEWLPLDPRSYANVNDLIDRWAEFHNKAHPCKGMSGGCGTPTMNATLCDDCEVAALATIGAPDGAD